MNTYFDELFENTYKTFIQKVDPEATDCLEYAVCALLCIRKHAGRNIHGLYFKDADAQVRFDERDKTIVIDVYGDSWKDGLYRITLCTEGGLSVIDDNGTKYDYDKLPTAFGIMLGRLVLKLQDLHASWKWPEDYCTFPKG